MPHVRCSKCGARATLARKPEEYTRLPRCRGCQRKMTAHPIKPTDPHYRVDRWRARHERGRNAPKCDPSRTGCTGYSFIHRRGSGYCDHNPNLTMEQLQGRRRWA